ncbi:DUF748 domain-containing protein [Noviherbaspirillum aerium]|uniref:DUF748 domain-containing protein n=1 Tax=Noviherbaspirillum aerium TaxID=2588497 RepID=UPI00124D7A46|nr:DUF748 domain-containing protein [Noviherbaspirillum aerium]
MLKKYTSRVWPPATGRQRFLYRIALALVSLLTLYTVAGFLLLPLVIKSRAEAIFAEKFKRHASIEKVRFNPFTLKLNAHGFRLYETDGKNLFADIETLVLDLSSESLFRMAPVIQELNITAPQVRIVRLDANRYNVDDIITALSEQPPSDEPARFSINNIQIDRGRIEFDDKPVRTRHVVGDLRLGIPFISSLPSEVQIFVEPLLAAKVNDTPVLIKGKARPFASTRDAVVDLNLDNFDLTRFVEYLPFQSRIKVPSAKLSMSMQAKFLQPEGKPAAVTLSGTSSLTSLQISEPDGKSIAKLAKLAVELRETPVFGDRISVARIALDGFQTKLVRGSDGRTNIERLLTAAQSKEPDPKKMRPASNESTSPRIAIGEIAVSNAVLHYADEAAARPMQADIEKLNLTLRKLDLDVRRNTINIAEARSDSAAFMLLQDKALATGSPIAPPETTKSDAAETKSAPGLQVSIGAVNIENWSARVEDRNHAEPAVMTLSPLSASLKNLSNKPGTVPSPLALKANVNQGGSLSLDGNVGIAPLQADIAVDIKGIDVLPLQPYITDHINLKLTRANLAASGRLQLAAAKDNALQGGFKGDLTLGNLATVDKLSGNDFLRWKSLFVGGMDVRLAPFAFTADQVALGDFFARVIIDPNGRINLQDIARGEAGSGRSLTERDAEKSGKGVAKASVANATSANNAGNAVTASSPARPSLTDAKASGAKASALPPITIRKLTLQGGRVRFTDNFIRPNYSTTLANFGGAVTGLSSIAGGNAEVDMRGEVNGAPLAVTGSINPLRGDLFLDLKANVRGMELAPLSAYSGRYVGYGIEKGKLSFEVAYRVDQRNLTAENRLILEQLTFGNKVDSPNATKLPVQFAIALLRDRNGVIDLNLPIGGSLDDPQFSIGGVLLKVIGNAILKAATQPFALLGSLFGGGAELSSIEYEPGRATIPSAGEDKLRSLARALSERPNLRLEIGGQVDPEADREGLKRTYLERRVRSLKLRDAGIRAGSQEAAGITVRPDEYADLVTRVYRDEKFPKPRNVLGLPKSIPVGEMEKLIIANAEVDEDDLIALGNQRAQNTKAWLQEKGQVPPERLFIVAPRIGKSDSASGSRVEFSLK